MRARVAMAVGLLALAATGQQWEEPYFSLSSTKTYAPGEVATIQVSAHGVDSLEFRVYRINDPVRFFEQLDEPHHFGREAPLARSKGRTPLEKFHNWKRRWRQRVADVARAQFTRENRGAIRSWRTPETPAPSRQVTSYAEAPVLNPQQLVSTWKQPVRRGERWETTTVPVEVKDPGLYVVEAVANRNGQALTAYTLVTVSNLTAVLKASRGRITAFVVERKTGEPVPNCPVIILAGQERLATLTTDGNGLAAATLKENFSGEEAVVLALRGRDLAVGTPGRWALGMEGQYMVGYVYSDRPVYRPGHTVHYKAILRQESAGGWTLPQERSVRVEVHDPDGQTVHSKTASVSPAGTVNGEWTLPQGAPLGYYGITIKHGEQEASGGVQVEEYKKPEYEVRVAPKAPRLLQGTHIEATIDARYFYGEPVANAKVTYVVHRGRYWFPYWGDPDDEPSEDDGGYAREQVAEEEGKLDAEGRLTIQVPAPVSEDGSDHVYRIEARVTDAGNREIAGSAAVVATHGQFMVRGEPAQYVYQGNERPILRLEAIDYDRKPVQSTLTVRALEVRREGGTLVEGKTVFTGDVATGPQGTGSVTLPPLAPGSYRVAVSAQDGGNRTVRSQTSLWVSGTGRGWDWADSEEITLVPDKKSYAPGDTARILIVTGVPGKKVLVTTEGRDLSDTRVVSGKGGTVTVEVPVKPEHAPNVYIAAAFLHEGTLHQGTKRLKVPATSKRLQVEVTTDKPQYKPGEPATVTVSARDAAGKPVSAEFSVGVVDEAIYGVQKETLPELFSFFHARVENKVQTDSSLNHYFYGEAGTRRMLLSRLAPRTTLAQLKPERLVQPKVRKAFPDTALWLASVTTDGSGRAQARLEFPDALTTWRTTARGVTADTRLGSAVQKTVVRKELMLSLVVPRFFLQGDEVTLSAVVRNYLPNAKTARVSLDVKGLEVLDGATRDVSIPSRGEAKLDWRVRALPGQQAVVLGKALTDEESDAMELTLPVNPVGVPQSLSRSGSLAATGEATASLTFPAEAVPASRSLEIEVSPSVAGSLFGALDYLTTFPYGCTEQTMSSFLPNVLVSRALKDLNVKSDVDEGVLQRKIRAGLDRLFEHQHEDGGWGWWVSDESHAFMTAYVVQGLAQARSAGLTSGDDRLGRGAQWLKQRIDKDRQLTPDLRAYAAYAMALAGQPDAVLHNDLWAARQTLSPYGLALLGLALEQAKDARASEAASLLEVQARQDEAEAYWPVERDDLLRIAMDATPEATAHALKLLTRQRPQSPLVPKAAVWLMAHRSEGAYWGSTKQTAMVVYGLVDYLKLTGELKPDFTATVEVNGRPVLTKAFKAADATAPKAPTFRLAAADLAQADQQVRITRRGSGRLYWSARADYYAAAEQPVKTGSASLEIARDYFKLVPEQTGEKVTHRLQPLDGPLQVGDVLAARLTVTGGPWSYVILEDPIPAGTELIPRDDLYEIASRPAWWRWATERRELRDDRAALFQTYMGSGEKQFVTLLKVVNPGRFRVNPARVQPMYQPRILATTESRVLEVR